MVVLLIAALAQAAPQPVPSCQEVRDAVRTGQVRLEDEALYARSLALHCRAAAAALGTLGTETARTELREREPWLRAYGLAHDGTDEGIDELLLWMATDPADGFAAWALEHSMDPEEADLGRPWGLDLMSEAQAWSTLAQGLDSPDPSTRAWAAAEVARNPDRFPLEEQVTAPGDPSRALGYHVVAALRGDDPRHEAWLWEQLAEPHVPWLVPDTLAQLTDDPVEREQLRAWSELLKEERCVDAWGRPVERTNLEECPLFEPLWASRSPDGRWFLDGRRIASVATGEVVLEAPGWAPFHAWSPEHSVWVGASYDDGALWFLWPETGRRREVRTPFQPHGLQLDRDTATVAGARYDLGTGQLLDPGPGHVLHEDRRVRLVQRHDSVWFHRDGTVAMLEPQPTPFVEGTGFFAGARAGAHPTRATVSDDGRRVAVMYSNGHVALYDMGTTLPPVEEGWPPLVPAVWRGKADAYDVADAAFVDAGPTPGPASRPTGSPKAPTREVLLSPDGRVVATLGTTRTRNVLHLWDARTGARWQQVLFSRPIDRLSFERDGQLQVQVGTSAWRLRPSPEGAEPERLPTKLEPVASRHCREVEVVHAGEKRRMLFDDNGLPCE